MGVWQSFVRLEPDVGCIWHMAYGITLLVTGDCNIIGYLVPDIAVYTRMIACGYILTVVSYIPVYFGTSDTPYLKASWWSESELLSSLNTTTQSITCTGMNIRTQTLYLV